MGPPAAAAAAAAAASWVDSQAPQTGRILIFDTQGPSEVPYQLWGSARASAGQQLNVHGLGF